MAISPFFHHVDAQIEKDLFHSLAEEFVYLAGINVQYLKTDALNGNFDKLFGENRFQVFNDATEIEMYLQDMERGYQGDDMFSKFGIKQSQTCTFLVAYKRFEEVFGHRPREGDYIYIPYFNDRGPDDIFRIVFVDVNADQYEAVGANFFYTIKTERAKFSHETFVTGNSDVDEGAAALLNDDSVENDLGADNSAIQELSDLLINFDETNPFGEP